MEDQNEEPTARLVHNGLVGIIGWLQLVRRRIKAGTLDQEQVGPALLHIETLTRETERKFSHIQNQLHSGARRGIMTDQDSSVVAEVGYAHSAPVLTIRFQNGNTYAYFDVPQQVHQELMAAESKGQYFNRQIRNRFPYKRVEVT